MTHARFRPAAWLPAVLGFLGALLPALDASAQSIDEKAQACAACHGDKGVPLQNTMPVIWGQQQGYLFLQLRDFKSGARKSDIMGPIAQGFERDDMLALALYFSQKPWPDLQEPRPPADVAAQAQKAAAAIGCNTCHQSGYLGDSTQPRLAGQRKEYLQQTMLDFRNRTRGNNPGMTDLMLAISEADIAACAAFLAAL
ncbi:MAG TPA: cytochrome c4 [Xanthobacteraceae bacterium]